jgi:membrane fusion protein, multidrug efflux system
LSEVTPDLSKNECSLPTPISELKPQMRTSKTVINASSDAKSRSNEHTALNSLRQPRIPVALTIAAILLTACGQPKAPLEEAPRPVRTMVAGSSTTDLASSYSGEVHARYESKLAFRGPGKVIERLVEVGSHVKRGQTLLRLDTAQETLQVTSADADMEAARSRVAKLRLDIDRMEKLFARKFASQAELDALRQASAEAEAGLKAAQARQAFNANQRSFAELKSERDGVVTALATEIGQVVGAGQPVVTVAGDGEREVLVSVPESRVDELRLAKSIQITVWALPGKRYGGVLRELAPDTDSVTRTYMARITVSDADATLRLGMTASVNLIDAAPGNAIRLPLTAIYDKSGQALVWVLDPKTSQVSTRKVVLGSAQNDSVWVKEGLIGGEIVVTAGVHMLAEGQKVLVAAANDKAAGSAGVAK